MLCQYQLQDQYQLRMPQVPECVNCAGFSRDCEAPLKCVQLILEGRSNCIIKILMPSVSQKNCVFPPNNVKPLCLVIACKRYEHNISLR